MINPSVRIKIHAAFASKDPSVDNNFTKGVKFSPDGTCLLTCSEDKKLRCFDARVAFGDGDAAEVAPFQEIQEQEPVNDFLWYPLMDMRNLTSWCFASTAKGGSVHLWDGYTGKLRCSYRAHNQYDEPTSAYSLAFTRDGTKMIAGYNRMVRIFPMDRPGNFSEERPTAKTKRDQTGQRGIISCIDCNPDMSGIYACGSYARNVWLYDERLGSPLMKMDDFIGGVTDVKFDPTGYYLLTACRKDNLLRCWDIRMTQELLYGVARSSMTNQRIGIDVDPTGAVVMSGGCDGRALTLALKTGDVLHRWESVGDCVNGVSIAPVAARGGVAALSTGQRHFPLPATAVDGSEEEEGEGETCVNAVLVYSAAVGPGLTAGATEGGPAPQEEESAKDE